MPFAVRTAVPSDAPAIGRIHRESIRTLCRSHYTAEQIEDWSARPSPEKYLPAIESGDALVGVEGEQILGFCLFDRHPAAIRVLYVSPDAARKGVGTALVRETERRLAGDGARELHVLSTLNAVPFYAALGFVAGEESRHPMPDGFALPCRRMAKWLEVPRGSPDGRRRSGDGPGNLA